MEPTLSEIQDYKGDANIAGGTAGEGAGAPAPNTPEFDQGLQFLNQASLARASYNKYLNDQYQQNLTNGLTALNNIDITKALPSDLPDLRQKYADLAKAYSDNMDVVQNPASNPALWSQLQQQEADLRGDIQQSSAHNVIATKNKEFLNTNPSWVTPENQAAVTNFENTPMADRKDFLLKAPVDFDITKVATAANAAAESSTKSMAAKKGSDWITTNEATKYNQDAYNNAVLGYAKNTSANGTTLYQKYLDNYNLLPATAKVDANGNPITPDQYILAQAAPFRKQTSTSTTISANPFTEQAKSEGFQAAQQQRQFAHEEKMAQKDELDPLVGAESKARTLAVIGTTGDIPDQLGQQFFGDNSLVEKKIVNATPSKDKNKNPLAVSTTTSTVKVPAVQYVGSSVDQDGNYHIQLRDNNTGQLLPDKVVTYPELYNAMDGMYGNGYAPKLAQGSSVYANKNFNAPIPSLQQLQQKFKVNPTAVTKPYQQWDDGSQNFSAPGAPAAAPAPINPATPAKALSDDAYQALKKKLLQSN